MSTPDNTDLLREIRDSLGGIHWLLRRADDRAGVVDPVSCPECGPGGKYDEDGCCAHCGSDMVFNPTPPEPEGGETPASRYIAALVEERDYLRETGAAQDREIARLRAEVEEAHASEERCRSEMEKADLRRAEAECEIARLRRERDEAKACDSSRFQDLVIEKRARQAAESRAEALEAALRGEVIIRLATAEGPQHREEFVEAEDGHGRSITLESRDDGQYRLLVVNAAALAPGSEVAP